MTAQTAFRRYLLPGFVFQSVVIAGGYGTGRELVEFFLDLGPAGGLLALAMSTLVFSAVAMASYEFARIHKAYDYRRFFKGLLGRGWVLFEASYLVLMIIILAVVAAASGAILEETFGLGYWVGVAAVMITVGVLAFGGSGIIERVFSVWSFVLYGVYIIFFAWCFQRFGGDIAANLSVEPVGSRWAWEGVRYAGYNLAIIPATFSALRAHTNRRDALVAGALTGPIAMIPALLFTLSMIGEYPAILAERVPSNQILTVLGSRAFQVTFQLVLFGTLIETGTGLIHAVNERIAGLLQDRDQAMPEWVRPVVAVGFLAVGTGVARFGLVDLIAKGYGTLTLAFIAIYVVPILTLGVWRIRRHPG
ncbi:MAG: hypothetical protein AMXMBFR53_44130 [Gemmatimonadota bacterium]